MAVAEKDFQTSVNQVFFLEVVEVELFGPTGEGSLPRASVLLAALREEIAVQGGREGGRERERGGGREGERWGGREGERWGEKETEEMVGGRERYLGKAGSY